MGSLQASMLEAFQSLREEFATQKEDEVESSLHATKPGSSSNNAAHLDLPPPRSGTNLQSEAMDVDYGPALPPRLVLNQDSSEQYVAPSEGHPEEVSYSHKKQSHRQCRHFCFSFDIHNYCPTCREAGKGDDPCVTFETPCQICTSFSDEQLQKNPEQETLFKKAKSGN